MRPSQAATSYFEKDHIVARIKKLDPLNNEAFTNPLSQKLTDFSFGLLFARVFGETLRFNTTAKSWCYYDGTVWRLDSGNMTAEKCANRLYLCLTSYIGNLMVDGEGGGENELP